MTEVDRQDTVIVIVDSLIQPYRDYLLQLDTTIAGISLDSARRYTNEVQRGLSKLSREVMANSADKSQAALESWRATTRLQDLSTRLWFKLLSAMPPGEKDKHIAGLWAFQYGQGFVNMNQIKELFHTFSPEVRASPVGKNTWEKISTSDSGIDLDTRDFYDDTLITIQDTPNTLGAVMEKEKPYKILVFGASWCRACRYGERLLKTWYTDLDTTRLEIINISIDTDRAAWKRSVEEDNLPWKSYLLPDLSISKLSRQLDFETAAVPLILLIDGNGRIVARNHDIRSIIRSIPFIRYEII